MGGGQRRKPKHDAIEAWTQYTVPSCHNSSSRASLLVYSISPYDLNMRGYTSYITFIVKPFVHARFCHDTMTSIMSTNSNQMNPIQHPLRVTAEMIGSKTQGERETIYRR